MDDETFALRDVLRVLRHHRWLIVAAIAMTTLAAVAISFAQPKRYTAQTQLVIGPTIPAAALPEGQSPDGPGPLGLDLPIETQARIVASPIMTARVARRLGLSPDGAQTEWLSSHVQVEAVTDNLLLITVNAPSAVAAAALANGYAKGYLDYRQEAAEKVLQAVSSDYQRRARDAQRRADEIDRKITAASADGNAEDVARLTGQRNELLEQVGTFTGSAQQASSSQASEYVGGEIIAPATPPGRSSSPNPSRNVLIALVLGGAAGVSIALLREHVNDRVRTRDEAARAANAPVLAALPKRRRQREARSELVTVSAPEAMASEGYRQLHRNLVRRGLGTQVRRLLVTSVEGGGSSTSETVANLGVLCARAGHGTMVIGADLRHSRLHRYFQIPNDEPGLAAGLTEPEDSSDDDGALSVLAGLRATERDLLVLPAGTAKFRPGEVFSSARLEQSFRLAAEIAPILIIEAPPILGSDDAITLTAHADATLLVVRAGVDKEALTARAAAILESAGPLLLGVVLHDAQKDDNTIGLFEKRGIEPDQALPSAPSEAAWNTSRLANGHPSRETPPPAADREESTRLAFGEQRPDAN
jgi:Mrp family chromosome partitioning ATPase/capsular polysaccharide biosynthesis protein